MAKQDEKQRLRRRLQDYAMELAVTNRWEEAIDINQQIVDLYEDPPSYNRLGKAYMEMGMLRESHDAYQHTLRLNPTNTIARRNLARLDMLLARDPAEVGLAFSQKQRDQVDLRLFITEAGKTIITSLVDVPTNSIIDLLATGERIELKLEGRTVHVLDIEGNVLGRLEPKLSQRLSELIAGGNHYLSAVVQSDSRQVRILIREIYQSPNQLGKTSFPGRLSDESGGYMPSMRYDYEAEELLEEDDTVLGEPDGLEDDYASNDSEEIGLDQIEKDMNDDDNNDD